MTNINNGFEIVKLNSQKFILGDGYHVVTGYCLKHKELGYLAFNTPYPYVPQGGKKALQDILNGGGFSSFDGITFIQ